MENEEKTALGRPMAKVGLTEEQVRHALIDFVLKNDEVKELVQDKNVVVFPVWHTTKWSDQNVLVHLDIVESVDEDDWSEDQDSDASPSDEGTQES